MNNDNSTDNTVDPEKVTTDELQDPMSGYATADAVPADDRGKDRAHAPERLRDPMSGYTGGDAAATDSKADLADVDGIHSEETKDSMSGYAGADALGPEQE